MKILFLGNPDPNGQDLLLDSLLYGLCRVAGSRNVHDYFESARYCARRGYLRDRQVHVGAFAYPALPSPGDYDLVVVYLHLLLHPETREAEMAVKIVSQLAPAGKTVVVNGYDNHPQFPTELIDMLVEPPCLIVHRPDNDWILPDYFLVRHFLAHISCPNEWLWYHLAHAQHRPGGISVYCAVNDNGPHRRKVMEALAAADWTTCEMACKFRWRSAEGYRIAGTTDTTTRLTEYLAETMNARCCISVPGANRDCLRTWEILALGRPLLTMDFGFVREFPDYSHCFYYQSPEECVDKARWMLRHSAKAEAAAYRGWQEYRANHTPEALARRILEAAGG